MSAKPVVDGIEKQLGPKISFQRFDVASPMGKKIAAKVGLDMVPTFIGYDGKGNERWRIERIPSRAELWNKLISL